MKDCRPRFPEPLVKAIENRQEEDDDEPIWQTVAKNSEPIKDELEKLSEEEPKTVNDIFGKSEKRDSDIDKILDEI